MAVETEQIRVYGVSRTDARAARRLVHAHARDEADELLLLDALGLGALPPSRAPKVQRERCQVCRYTLKSRNHRTLCGI